MAQNVPDEKNCETNPPCYIVPDGHMCGFIRSFRKMTLIHRPPMLPINAEPVNQLILECS